MRTLTGRLLTAGVGLSMALATIGCSPIQIVTSPLVTGSQWHVVSVDDESTVDLELILTFIGDSATLSSRCGASSGEVEVDPEGHAVSFGALQGLSGQPICPAEATALHERVADALEGVDRWVSAGSNIELHGERVIRLRPQATDT